MNDTDMDGRNKIRVLILGGGFSGVAAAQYLGSWAARRAGIEVTLVSRDNYALFTPMLLEVAGGDLDPVHITNPLRKLLGRVIILEANVDSIDLVKKRVVIEYGINRQQRDLVYDYLVLALGSETSFPDIPGVAEGAVTMKTLGDAILLRNRLIALLELASVEQDSDARKAMLTFVVSGGGFAGVETVGAINDLVRESVVQYPLLDPAMVRVVLIHGGGTVLPELGEKLGIFAQQELRKREVDVRLKTRVIGYTDGRVLCSEGESIEAQTLIWAAGVTPIAAMQNLPVRKSKERIVVTENLEVPGQSGVWAVGDCAAATDPATSKPYPPTAQHGMRQGDLVGRNIAARIGGQPPRAFAFSSPGQLAAIGRRTGVARIFGINFSGFLAWALWRAVYLSKLPRLEKKLRVAIEWTFALFFPRDLVQYVTIRDFQAFARTLDHARSQSPQGRVEDEHAENVTADTDGHVHAQ
jgi:NADH dehydrogenase